MNKVLENIVKKIEGYNKDEQLNILEIIIKHNPTCCSENNNGTFVKMDKLNEATIKEIEEYIAYIEKKEEDINVVECKMNEIKKDLNI